MDALERAAEALQFIIWYAADLQEALSEIEESQSE
jgi:hypothetical protein